MQLQKAERKRVKLRLNIASPSGFGKTYSALQMAFGITNNWETICVVDTENDSASLYSHLGNYNTVRLDPPYTADRYIEAIKLCEKSGIEVIIIDSITHLWKGAGGMLEYQSSLGGRYQDWARVTPLYQKWLNTILQSTSHVITTNRKKQGYNMITEGNKTKVEKAGLDDEIRDGYEYEMTVALEIINDKHLVRASKDRTGLFADKPEFVITQQTGKMILDWCNGGKVAAQVAVDHLGINLLEQIKNCTTVDALITLYKQQTSDLQSKNHSAFTQRRYELDRLKSNPITQIHKAQQNGNTNS